MIPARRFGLTKQDAELERLRQIRLAQQFQWLTTAPNPYAPAYGYDQGQRGWRLHAVQATDDETLTQVRGRKSVCGILPAHGWDLDMFIEQRCKRCTAKLQL